MPWATARTPISSGMRPRLMRMLEKSAAKPGSNRSRRAGDMGWGSPAPDRRSIWLRETALGSWAGALDAGPFRLPSYRCICASSFAQKR